MTHTTNTSYSLKNQVKHNHMIDHLIVIESNVTQELVAGRGVIFRTPSILQVSWGA